MERKQFSLDIHIYETSPLEIVSSVLKNHLDASVFILPYPKIHLKILISQYKTDSQWKKLIDSTKDNVSVVLQPKLHHKGV